MGRESALIINDIHCDYTPLVWPFYRGTTAQPVVLAQGARKGVAYRKALTYDNNTIEVRSPDKPGADSDSTPFRVLGVFSDIDVVKNADEHSVTLFDARFHVSRFTSPFRFNVKQGDTYQSQTAESKKKPATLEFALKKFEDLIGKEFNVTYADPKAILKDELNTDGKSAEIALAEVLEDVAHDLTVGIDGELYVVNRSQATALAIQSLHQYAWRREPGFLFKNAKKHSAPEKIIVPYRERREMKMVNKDFTSPSRRTVARSSKKAASEFEEIPFFSIEQVYRWRGKYLNAEELELEIFKSNNVSFVLSDNLVAKHFLSRNWEGSVLDQQLSLNFKQLIPVDKTRELARQLLAQTLLKIVREDWRTLWRLQIHSGGKAGAPIRPDLDAAWTDLTFGTIEKDGSIGNGTVQCPWVDFFSTPILQPKGARSRLLGAKMSENKPFGDAPFTPTWEDPDLRILRLKAVGPVENLRGRVPGELNKDITVRAITNADRDKAEIYGGKIASEFGSPIVKTTRDRGTFNPIMPMEVSLVGLKQFPNSTAKWTLREHDTDIEGATAGELWATPDDNITANYKFDDQKEPANNKELAFDSFRRASILTSEYNVIREGAGEAHGTLLALNELPVRGAIESINVNFGTETKPYVSSTVTIKNFTDAPTRLATQARRGQRRYKSKGKKTQ